MLKLEYKLEKEEIAESLLCAKWRYEGTLKKWNIIILSVLNVILLLYFYGNAEKSLYFIYLIIINGLLFFLLYFLDFRRDKIAKKIYEKNSKIILKINEQLKTLEVNKIEFPLYSQETEVLLSENVITVKTNKDIICIPNRVLTQKENEALFFLFSQGCKVIKIITQ